MDCDLENVYGTNFFPFLSKEPHSVFIAKGSPVVIRKPKYITEIENPHQKNY